MPRPLKGSSPIKSFTAGHPADEALHSFLTCPQVRWTSPQTDSQAAPHHLGMLSLYRIDSSTTLGGAAAAYLEHLEVQVALGRSSPNTLHARRYGLRFLGDLASIELASLRRSAILAWAESLAQVQGVVRRVTHSLDFSAIRALQVLLSWCADRDACIPGLANRIFTGYRPTPGRALCSARIAIQLGAGGAS